MRRTFSVTVVTEIDFVGSPSDEVVQSHFGTYRRKPQGGGRGRQHPRHRQCARPVLRGRGRHRRRDTGAMTCGSARRRPSAGLRVAA